MDVELLPYLRATRTRVRRCAIRLTSMHAEASNDEVRWLAGYEAADLLGSLLNAAERLVPLLNDDQPDEVASLRRRAKGLAEALRAKMLAPKLANVEGRTPEEAELFAAKAQELLR